MILTRTDESARALDVWSNHPAARRPREPSTIRDRHDRAVLLTLALLTTVTAVVSSLGAPLVPSIAAAYDVHLNDAQWALTSTMLAGAVATPVVGRLGSGRLRRPVVLGGLVVVALGTALAALPLGFGALVAGRALQGLGLALVPLALAIARDVVAPERLGPTIALLSVTTVAGAGFGYPLTALVAQLGGLHGAYVLGLVLTTTTLAMAWRYVPRDGGADPDPVDWTGAALLGGGMVAVLLAVSQGGHWGWTAPVTPATAAAGVVLLGAWVAWTLRRRDPLVDLRLAVRPGVAGPNLVAVVAGVGMYSALTMVMVLVQGDEPGFGFGQPVLVAGLMLVPYSVGSVVGSRLAQAVARRTRSGVLLPTGCALFLTSSLGLALAHDHLAAVVVWMGVGGLGSGFSFSSLAVLMVPHVPRAETGSAMAFNQVLRYLGFSTGSAVSVALLTAFGGGTTGFRDALLVLSAVWVVIPLALWWLARRPAAPSPVGEPLSGPGS